jgi:hypothetical protein
MIFFLQREEGTTRSARRKNTTLLRDITTMPKQKVHL